MILPAILENSLEEIKRKIKVVEKLGVKLVHIDIIDDTLVKGQTYTDLEQILAIDTNLKFQLHLMVNIPERYLINHPKIDSVIAHIEAKEHMDKYIEKAQTLGYKVGVALNPETDVSFLWPHTHRFDFIQFMTVEPGAQGKKFNFKGIDKIPEFKKQHPTLTTQIDGHVSIETIDYAIESGVDNLVVGSAIVKSDDPEKAYNKLANYLSRMTNNKPKIRQIAFLGGAAWKAEDQAYIDAFEVAKLLAENGYEIVNGGGPGVMRASTKGAHAGGGKALAVTYYPNKIKRHYEGVDKENNFDEEVKTLDYFDRTKVMLQTTDMHIVFNGSIGTLSELGMTWISSWIHEPNDKPIVLFGEFWYKYIDYVKSNMYLKHGEEHLLRICTKPEEVLAFLKELEDEGQVSSLA